VKETRGGNANAAISTQIGWIDLKNQESPEDQRQDGADQTIKPSQ
jgi:hypothetical protein